MTNSSVVWHIHVFWLPVAIILHLDPVKHETVEIHSPNPSDVLSCPNKVPLLCLALRNPCATPWHWEETLSQAFAPCSSRQQEVCFGSAEAMLKESQTWFFWLQIRWNKSVKNPRATSIHTVAVARSSPYSCCGVPWIPPALLSCCALVLRWIFCPNPAHPVKAARPTKPSWIISSCFCSLIATGQFHCLERTSHSVIKQRPADSLNISASWRTP